MLHNKLFCGTLLALSTLVLTANAQDTKTPNKVSKYETIAFENIKVGGELKARLQKNLNRLEEEKYQPDNVFLTEQQSGYWPGDTEGRTILGIIMDARATGRTPRYLDEIINRIPAHLNELGYMGTIHRDSVDEQQLSGNGWFLRGLCEYYLWKKDSKQLPIIKRLAENLFLPGDKYYNYYPISPESRKQNIGEASGSLSQIIGHWRLSTDIGCVFIGMEGLLHALQVTGDEKLRPVADKLINLYLNVDLTGIKAQTHASLTAMRGLIRYADITKDTKYISEVEKRWEIYKKFGMTEFYGNYNWFCRYDTWTEPCAIVDAFIVAAQLWQHTGKAEYREDAELIYYNAICLAQRDNGGFGLEMSPGKTRNTYCVSPNCDEAHWCCTMRGGEGLGRAADFTAFKNGNELAMPFLRDAIIADTLAGGGYVKLEVKTGYPITSYARIKVVAAPKGKATLSFAKASWAENYSMSVNGKPAKYEEADGLAKITRHYKNGDEIKITFTQKAIYKDVINKENNETGAFRVMYGPLVLGGQIGNNANMIYGEPIHHNDYTTFVGKKSGTKLSPLYHLMSPSIRMDAKPAYSRRIIFTR